MVRRILACFLAVALLVGASPTVRADEGPLPPMPPGWTPPVAENPAPEAEEPAPEPEEAEEPAPEPEEAEEPAPKPEEAEEPAPEPEPEPGPDRSAETARLDALEEALKEKGLRSLEAELISRGHDSMPWEDLVQLIEGRRETPLPVWTGRPMAYSKIPSEEDEPRDEKGMVKARVLAPADDSTWDRWNIYVRGKDERSGAKVIREVLTIRRRARVLKFRVFLEEATGKSWDAITEEDVAPLRDGDPTYRWLASDIFEPQTIVFKTHAEDPSGPAHLAMPALHLLPAGSVEGAGEHMGLATDEKGRFYVRRTDSRMILPEGRGEESLEKAIEGDLLAPILAHELFHGIQYDLVGDYAFQNEMLSKNGHDTPVISNRYLAFAEGWAEMAEAWKGHGLPGYDNSEGKAPAPDWELGRQEPIRRNLYINEDYEKFVVTKKARRRSRIKNGTQMISSEGVVAGVLYKLLTHKKLDDPMEQMLRAHLGSKAQTLTDFVASMAARAPTPKQAAIIRVTFLHATRFATVSSEARLLFQESDEARLAWLKAKNQSKPVEEVDSLKSAMKAATERYRTYTLELLKQVESGELALDAAVGHEIWLEAVVGEGEKAAPVRYDLNSALFWELRDLGLPSKAVRTIVLARDRTKNGFRDITQLRHHLEEDAYAELLKLRTNFLEGVVEKHETKQEQEGEEPAQEPEAESAAEADAS